MRAMSGVVFGLFLLATFAAAAFGARFLPGPWYEALAKPSWNPPNWLFGPVWTVLYIAIAVAAWMVWRQVGWQAAAAALTVWLLQLVLNGAWSWLFFGLRRPGWALVEILVLWVVIAITVALFWRLRPAAGALLLPYLAWVSFAALLNGTIWRLNS